MSLHAIPDGIDPIILTRAIELKLLHPTGWFYVYGNGADANPTGIEFTPDLQEIEAAYLQKIFTYAADLSNFDNLPDWANWTPAQAENHVLNAILNGRTLEEVDADIDGLPATVAGMRAGLHSVADALIDTRTVLIKMARAIIYLRGVIRNVRD